MVEQRGAHAERSNFHSVLAVHLGGVVTIAWLQASIP
jgi:hypothetical protein